MRSWLKRYGVALLGTLAAVLIVAGLGLSSGVSALDYAGLPPESGHLASEATDPYLSSGKPPKHPKHRTAARHFPDVRSCLVKSERDATTPDLRRIDWARMRTREQTSVCLFRIFASLETPDRAVGWLAAQGLRTDGPTSGSFNRTPIVTVHGYNSPQRDRRVYVGSSLLTDWLTMRTCYNASFHASWDEDGRLLGTGYIQNYL